jgi:small subunit ribosomal protein S7
MPRHKKIEFVREIGGDPRFQSELIQKLINVIMERGKKSRARTIVYEAMDALIQKAGGDEKKALTLFHRAYEQIVPLVEVRARRVGGSVYQIPVEVATKRGRSLAMRWLIDAAHERTDKTMGQRLAKELIEAAEGRGGAVKKKSEVQRMAEANRAFSHYAW